MLSRASPLWYQGGVIASVQVVAILFRFAHKLTGNLFESRYGFFLRYRYRKTLRPHPPQNKNRYRGQY